MTFVYPSFLWALGAVALPVIIHLFNFRKYKKVYFSNVRFLRELQLESKSRSRLREILVLICRCLAIACLVIAFCQPVLKGDDHLPVKSGAKDVSIYIDNSFSMNNVSRQGPLFQLAKAQARDLINAFGSADKFQIITNDFEGRHQRFHTKDDALSTIEDLKVSPVQRSVGDVLKRQTDFLKSGDNETKRLLLLSDAQKSTFDLRDLRSDSLIKTSLVLLKGNHVNNVSVDTCWFDSPLQQKGFIQKLHARVLNNGSNRIELGSARLKLNEKQVAISSFSLDPWGQTELTFVFENKDAGFNYGSLKIEDYPVTFDDELFFAFNSQINVAVTLINGRDQNESNSLSSLFSSDSLFELRVYKEQGIDFGTFRNSDVIILNQLNSLGSGLISELDKFIQKGGALVIIPQHNLQAEEYNQGLRTLKLPEFGVADTSRLRTDRINNQSGFFSGVFEKTDERMNLPLVTRHFLIGNRGSDFENIIALQNGDPFLSTLRRKNALVYLFSSPLSAEGGNFNRHALFLPTFYRICFSSLRPAPLFYQTGANDLISIASDPLKAEAPPHIISLNKETDVIPEMRTSNGNNTIFTKGQVTQPGYYELQRAEKRLLPLAFNYSRKESDLRCYSPEELQEIINNEGLKNFEILDGTGQEALASGLINESGKKLWKLFIILTLTFLLLEALLLRLLK